MRTGRPHLIAASALVALVLTGCGGGRSLAAVCATFDANAHLFGFGAPHLADLAPDERERQGTRVMAAWREVEAATPAEHREAAANLRAAARLELALQARVAEAYDQGIDPVRSPELLDELYAAEAQIAELHDAEATAELDQALATCDDGPDDDGGG